MAKQFALTTHDNPFDPFDDFASWNSYDKQHYYNSSEKLMRVAVLSDEMTIFEENAEIERAIDEIIKYDFMNVYKKKSRDLTLPED